MAETTIQLGEECSRKYCLLPPATPRTTTQVLPAKAALRLQTGEAVQGAGCATYSSRPKKLTKNPKLR